MSFVALSPALVNQDSKPAYLVDNLEDLGMRCCSELRVVSRHSYLVDLAASWLPEFPQCDPLARKGAHIIYVGTVLCRFISSPPRYRSAIFYRRIKPTFPSPTLVLLADPLTPLHRVFSIWKIEDPRQWHWRDCSVRSFRLFPCAQRTDSTKSPPLPSCFMCTANGR